MVSQPGHESLMTVHKVWFRKEERKPRTACEAAPPLLGGVDTGMACADGLTHSQGRGCPSSFLPAWLVVFGLGLLAGHYSLC
jgi:hypothetical protein